MHTLSTNSQSRVVRYSYIQRPIGYAYLPTWVENPHRYFYSLTLYVLFLERQCVFVFSLFLFCLLLYTYWILTLFFGRETRSTFLLEYSCSSLILVEYSVWAMLSFQLLFFMYLLFRAISFFYRKNSLASLIFVWRVG